MRQIRLLPVSSQRRCSVDDVAGRGLKLRRSLHGPVAMSPQPRVGKPLDHRTMKQPACKPGRLLQSRRCTAGREPAPPGLTPLWCRPPPGTPDVDRFGAHIPTFAGPVSKRMGIPTRTNADRGRSGWPQRTLSAADPRALTRTLCGRSARLGPGRSVPRWIWAKRWRPRLRKPACR
jgi:hypothetical protein